MKKKIWLLLIPFLLLSVILVYAEISHKDYSANTRVITYDMDDFANYLKENNDGTNTKALIEAYSKDETKRIKRIINLNDPDLYEIKELDGKEIKVFKKIKTVMINSYQTIDFYADGNFSVGTTH